MFANTHDIHSQIRQNAEQLNQIHEKMHYNDYDSHRFFSKFDELAWPGGLNEGKRRLREGDPEEIEIAICFLEEDPSFYRSSNIKSDVIRILCRHPLSEAQKKRLGDAICRLVDTRLGREFIALGRLAKKIDNPRFRGQLYQRLNSDSLEIRQRAQTLVRAMQ
ncbi:MAG TPA: hypothetical protein PLS90_09335 [Candidatus Sumerlaeota bacterium]|nr:hypothetical protein [Candidatus Sumerlaeota bacterium]HPK02647.1 hypothetical protein [Candidatus Sumerlaeota bacterium]